MIAGWETINLNNGEKEQVDSDDELQASDFWTLIMVRETLASVVVQARCNEYYLDLNSDTQKKDKCRRYLK